jgi:hypothetical protein
LCLAHEYQLTPLCSLAEDFIIRHKGIEESCAELFQIAKRLQLEKLKCACFGHLITEFVSGVLRSQMPIEDVFELFLDAKMPSQRQAAENLLKCAKAFSRVLPHNVKIFLLFLGKRFRGMDKLYRCCRYRC